MHTVFRTPHHDHIQKMKYICEPHMAKATCFSAVLNGKTKYRRIRQ